MDMHLLVTMANDIAAFFDAEPDKAAAAQQAGMHLRRYWAPPMRTAIGEHLAGGGEGLSDLARRAVEVALRL